MEAKRRMVQVEMAMANMLAIVSGGERMRVGIGALIAVPAWILGGGDSGVAIQ